jgi:hypothetical protein
MGHLLLVHRSAVRLGISLRGLTERCDGGFMRRLQLGDLALVSGVDLFLLGGVGGTEVLQLTRCCGELYLVRCDRAIELRLQLRDLLANRLGIALARLVGLLLERLEIRCVLRA